jgi:hypothetical protein
VAPTTWYAAVMPCNTSLPRAPAWIRCTAMRPLSART